MSKGAQGGKEGREGGERARGRRSSPESKLVAGGNGGLANAIVSSLGALVRCDERGKDEEREGFKRDFGEWRIKARNARNQEGE